MKNTSVTLEDIANQAGVSTAAVSLALSGKGTLTQSTRDRILGVVEELSYKPDRVAQSLALRRTSQAHGKKIAGSARKNVPPPGIMVFYDTTELTEVVHLEIQQREEEGCDVAEFRNQLQAWTKPGKQKLYDLYTQVLSAPLRPEWPYEEPDHLADIQKARPAGQPQTQITLTASSLYNKIYGAWLGRAAGSVLGKPLQAGLSKNQVVHYLQLANSYPLLNYVPRVVPQPSGYEFKPETAVNFLGEIHGAPYDDDTDFSLLALHILETYGVDFKTADVATEWLSHLTYFGTYTTDRAIYRNLVWNTHPEDAANFVNPEREFIGARTRADVYGYVAPGRPELSSALAYKDASLSHTKNGRYSAMMMAAMVSWAFVTDHPVEIIQTGLAFIPQNCRLAEAVGEILESYLDHQDWELTYERMLLKYGSYSPIHTINNTLWVVLALLYSEGSFSRGLGLAVTCGMDTGSNAASVGSILGMCSGYDALPEHWVHPLEDRLSTGIAQFPEANISELARRTVNLTEKFL